MGKKFVKIPYEKNDLPELSPEQIALAKATFGKVYLIKVEDKKAYLHKPNRLVLDNADAQSKRKSSRFNETLMKGCWLAGDKELVNDDDYFMGASTQLDQMIEFKEAELKEL